MALDENAIKIIIAAELKKKGFQDAEKATTGLDKKFKQLGATLAATFSARAVLNFVRITTSAFVDKQKETAQLTSALESLNQAFRLPEVDAFLDKLEDAYKVGGDQLVPAFSQLARVTQDVTKSQDLLGLSLDIAAGSGKDLQTVTAAISRAMAGNTAALGRLNVGLDKNILKFGDLDDILDILRGKFEGAASRAVNTFEGDVKTLRIAADRAAETIGEGLVDAIDILGGQEGITGAANEMQRLADETGNAIRGFAVLSRSLGVKQGAGFGLADIAGAIPVAGAYLAPFIQSLIKKGALEAADRAATGPLLLDVEKEIKAAKNRAKIEEALNKANTKALALTKKQIKAQTDLNKKKKEEGILGDISKRFDEERIQIQAALAGQINEVEKLRLELMQAILDEDVKRAIILEGQLIKAEAAAQELAYLLDSLDEMVGDPFADWPGTISRIQELLKTLNVKIPIETLFAEKGLRLDQEKMTVTKLDRMDVNATNVYINGGFGGGGGGGGTMPKTSLLGLSDEIVELFKAGDPTAIAAVESHAAAIQGLADAELMLAESTLAESMINQGMTVNITVQGNVTTEQDLVTAITDNLYQWQKSGKGLLYSSVAI